MSPQHRVRQVMDPTDEVLASGGSRLALNQVDRAMPRLSVGAKFMIFRAFFVLRLLARARRVRGVGFQNGSRTGQVSSHAKFPQLSMRHVSILRTGREIVLALFWRTLTRGNSYQFVRSKLVSSGNVGGVKIPRHPEVLLHMSLFESRWSLIVEARSMMTRTRALRDG